MKLKKLNHRGIVHHLGLVLVVALLFGIIGSYFYLVSHADTTDTATAGKTGQLSVYLKNSAGTVMCLDDNKNISTNGNPVYIYPCTASNASQQWTPYSDHTIRIHGKCLDVKKNGTVNGTPIDIYTCNGNNNQKWDVGTNVHVSLNDLESRASGKCLDVYGSQTANNSTVDIWGCDSTTAQVWGWNYNGNVVPGGATADANCHGHATGNVCYYWAQAFQQGNGNFSASGVSTRFTQPNPYVSPAQPSAGVKNESIAEINSMSADMNQHIEFGWLKTDTDKQPNVFAAVTVNSKFLGYVENGGTGFVTVNNIIGTPVTVSTPATYKIVHSGSQWQLWYNGVEAGYFPDSLWTSQGTTFNALGDIAVYGEVGTGVATVSKTEMGNGTLGSQAGSSSVSNYSLIGSSVPAQLTNFAGPTGFGYAYNYGNPSDTGFRYGGPGF